MPTKSTAWRIGILALAMITMAAPAAVAGPVLQVSYLDPPGFGFNDPTPVQPVAGNPHTTRGAQRRAVMAAALDIWATHIDSRVPIRVGALFEDLGCGEGSFLGFGNTASYVANFPGAPEGNVNYPVGLANHISGQRASAVPELRVRFNARVDTEACFASIPDGFWYGLGEPQSRSSRDSPFLTLVLHEIGHGLGYITTTNLSTGVFNGSPARPDVYSKYLYSVALQRGWRQMTPSQRSAAAVSEPDLVWSGERANTLAAEHLLPPGQIRVEPAVDGQQHFPALIHGLPPFPSRAGLAGRLVVADSDTDDPADPNRVRTDACQPLTNAAAASGSIVLVTRGACTFDTKWRHAYGAGAGAMVVADTLQPTGGSQLARNQGMLLLEVLPIPIWSVDRAVGERLLADPPARITLAYDETRPPIGSNDGMLVMEAKPPLVPATNVVHVSNSTFPTTAMASGVGGSQIQGMLQFSPGVLHDLGWPDMEAKQAQIAGNWYNPARSGEGCQLTLEADHHTWVITCYTYQDGQQAWMLGTAQRRGDRLDFDDVHIARGTGFGSAFDPAAVQRLRWGRIRMEVQDCNHALLQFLPELDGYADFQLYARKVVAGDCQRTAANQPNRDLSGSWYDPARSGEGIQLSQEADGLTVVLAFYTHLDGEQLWMLGTSRLTGAAGPGNPAVPIDRLAFDDMHFTHGGRYGRDFDPAAIERTVFGSITMEFIDCNHARVSIAPTLAAFEPGERLLRRIVPRSCP
jgi:hypothetical protein